MFSALAEKLPEMGGNVKKIGFVDVRQKPPEHLHLHALQLKAHLSVTTIPWPYSNLNTMIAPTGVLDVFFFSFFNSMDYCLK